MRSHKKYVTTAIAYPDLTSSTAVDLEGWHHVALQFPANTFTDATAQPHILGCATDTGTFVQIAMDGTQAFQYSAINPIKYDCQNLPRYLKISGGDSTVTAAAGFTTTVHLGL